MDSILHQLSLTALSECFINERTDPGVASSMSDGALAHLKVNTIGDRILLRELCTKYVSNQRQTNFVWHVSELELSQSVLPYAPTARIEDISLIRNPSCTYTRSNSPSTDCGIKKIGAPHVPLSFFGASPPNFGVFYSQRHHITARIYA